MAIYVVIGYCGGSGYRNVWCLRENPLPSKMKASKQKRALGWFSIISLKSFANISVLIKTAFLINTGFCEEECYISTVTVYTFKGTPTSLPIEGVHSKKEIRSFIRKLKERQRNMKWQMHWHFLQEHDSLNSFWSEKCQGSVFVQQYIIHWNFFRPQDFDTFLDLFDTVCR